MFIGCPISTDFFSAAAITRRASANVTMILSVLKLEFLLGPKLEVRYDLRLSQYTSNGLRLDYARGYSQRKAIMGSTSVAFRAGTYPANNATQAIPRVA